MTPQSDLSEFLLDGASIKLQDAGFETRKETVNGSSWILAESEWFVVGVVAPKDLIEAVTVEAAASAALVARVAGPESGAKMWDAYLAVLIQDSVDPRDESARQTLDGLQYNTRGIRRLISTGIHDEEALEVALRPLLPLPPAADKGLPEPFADLVSQLVTNGLEADEADRLVSAFIQTGDLDNV